MDTAKQGIGEYVPDPTASQRHLTPQELADRLSVPLSSVYGWRARHTGPRGMRIGKHVRYRMVDVLAWEQEQIKREAA